MSGMMITKVLSARQNDLHMVLQPELQYPSDVRCIPWPHDAAKVRTKSACSVQRCCLCIRHLLSALYGPYQQDLLSLRCLQIALNSSGWQRYLCFLSEPKKPFVFSPSAFTTNLVQTTSILANLNSHPAPVEDILHGLEVALAQLPGCVVIMLQSKMCRRRYLYIRGYDLLVRKKRWITLLLSINWSRNYH